MKKYFVKYLPVEGEATCINKECINCGSPLIPTKKLFLCSKDIKVGDIYYNDNFELTKYPNASIAGSSTNQIGKNESYKVIGEISPDALSYIEEGMEFDKDEVEIQTVDDNTVIIDREPMSDSPVYADKTMCRIKGPCGHFH